MLLLHSLESIQLALVSESLFLGPFKVHLQSVFTFSLQNYQQTSRMGEKYLPKSAWMMGREQNSLCSLQYLGCKTTGAAELAEATSCRNSSYLLSRKEVNVQ